MRRKKHTNQKPLFASWKIVAPIATTIAIVGIVLVYTQKPQKTVQGIATHIPYQATVTQESPTPTILPTKTYIFSLPRRR